MRRVAIVTGIPAPYREPVFAELAARPGHEVRVYYCARGHGDVAWHGAAPPERARYAHEFLPNWTPAKFRRLPFLGYANLALSARLRSFAPTNVLVYGYNQWSHWLAFRHCRRHGAALALRSDSNAELDRATGLRQRLRRRLLRTVAGQAAAVLAVGSANRDYWRGFGVADERIVAAPYAVDNARLAACAERRADDPAGRVRFLYVGRLLPRKGVDLLLDAFERVHDERTLLTIVGDGPERAALQARQSPAAAARTRWLGKLANDAALACYAEADAFVLPSRYEPWGLVVNEAMAAGLPVIADRRGGAARDLLADGAGGILLERVSSDGLAAAMARYRDDPAAARRAGAAARARVQAWNFARTVDGFVAGFALPPPSSRRRGSVSESLHA